MAGRVFVFGATGYTGRLIAAEASRRGLACVLCGRDQPKLAALADELALPYRAVSLENAGRLRDVLADASVVLNAAGPFFLTAPPLIEASLAVGAHYLDLTGEVDVVEAAARRHAEAVRRRVMIMPAVGFDVVASDCLARHVADRLRRPRRLRIGISGLRFVSRGSARTIVEQIGEGVAVRRGIGSCGARSRAAADRRHEGAGAQSGGLSARGSAVHPRGADYRAAGSSKHRAGVRDRRRSTGEPLLHDEADRGDTLADWSARAGGQAGFTETLSEMMVAYLKVCDAVAFAHSRGVLHCDIKPGNILVGTFGQVYLVDWGLAIVGATPVMPNEMPTLVVAGDSNLDAGGGPCGTPAFMSPEQAQGARDRLDERTDVFGLGAVLYNILTGVPPFDSDDVAICLDKATACAVSFPPGDPAAPLPVGLCRIVKRAMARDPSARYQTVTELKKDVEMTLRGFPLSAEMFTKGTRIVSEGDSGDCAYIIVRGSCLAYKTVDGERVVLRRLAAGAVFGETAVLSGGIRTATVEAEEEVLVQVVPRQLLEENLGLHTSFGLFVVALAERFREAEQRLGTGVAGAKGIADET
jgi:Protein kinase domain/Cyclic nucleotide-binding domain/Saccharopine dehydrogenase NADP binding domain